MALYICAGNLIISSLTQPFYNITIAFEKLRLNALGSIFANIFYCLSLLAAIFFRKGLLVLVSVTLATSFIELIIATFICIRYSTKPSFRFDKKIWLTVAKLFAPFAFYLVFTGLYRRIDIIMLSWMKTDSAVGFYSAAYKIIYLFILIPASLSKAIFPLLSEQASRAKDEFKKTISRSVKYLLAISFPIVLGGSFFSEKIILLLFGQQFLSSVLPLKILIFSLIFVFWHSILSQGLIAASKMAPLVLGTTLTFIINLTLNFFVIPKYSYVGAAWTTLVSEIFAGCWFYISLRRTVAFAHPIGELSRILSAALGMLVILSIFANYNLFIILPLGLVFYIIILWKVNFFTPAEIGHFKELLGRGNTLYKKDEL